MAQLHIRSSSTTARAKLSRTRARHVRKRSSYGDIKVPALKAVEELSEIEEECRPRNVWTDITAFYKNWKYMSGRRAYGALFIFPDIDIRWILDPEKYYTDHYVVALHNPTICHYLQFKYTAGELHCFKNNPSFWVILNHQLTTNLTDPTLLDTEKYPPLILKESFYDSNAFSTENGVTKKAIISILRGQSLDAEITEKVIKVIIVQSIHTLDFVDEYSDYSPSSSTAPSPLSLSSSSSASTEEEKDLSDEDFIESILNGVSTLTVDTRSRRSGMRANSTDSNASLRSQESKQSEDGHLTPDPSISPDNTVSSQLQPSLTFFGSVSSRSSVSSSCGSRSINSRDFETPNSFCSVADIGDLLDEILYPNRDQSIVSTPGTSTSSPSVPWPLPRTASEEADDQKQFCIMSGSKLPKNKWHISEVYYDQNKDFMRKSDEKTRPYPISGLKEPESPDRDVKEPESPDRESSGN